MFIFCLILGISIGYLCQINKQYGEDSLLLFWFFLFFFSIIIYYRVSLINIKSVKTVKSVIFIS